MGTAKGGDITIRDIYAALTEDELRAAEANFRRYLEVAVRVQKELHSSPGSFDSSPVPATMKERSDSLKS